MSQNDFERIRILQLTTTHCSYDSKNKLVVLKYKDGVPGGVRTELTSCAQAEMEHLGVQKFNMQIRFSLRS